MSNNTVLNAGSGGDTIQTVDNSTFKTQVIALTNSAGTSFVGLDTTSTSGVELRVRNGNQVATGTLGSLNATASFTGLITNGGTVGVSILGTFVGTISAYGCIDGTTTYLPINLLPIATGIGSTTLVFGTSGSLNGGYQADVSGFRDIMLKATAYTSGSAAITMTISQTSSILQLDGPIPSGTNLVGKFGIDQTTVGTTNSISLGQITGTAVLNGGTAGSLGVGGLAGAGSSASGNPLLSASVFNTTQPTYTSGQVSQNQATSRGALLVSLASVDNTVSNAGYIKISDGVTAASVITTINSLKTDLSSIAGTATVNGGLAGTLAVGGVTATLSSTSGNPVYGGGIALVGANPTKATNAQRTGLATDAAGRLLVAGAHDRTMAVATTTTITSTTSATTIVAAAGSGVFTDIVSLTITNGSATSTIATLSDGTKNVGVYNLGAGSGVVLTFPTPLPQSAANLAWTLTCGTSVASIYVAALYIKNT